MQQQTNKSAGVPVEMKLANGSLEKAAVLSYPLDVPKEEWMRATLRAELSKALEATPSGERYRTKIKEDCTIAFNGGWANKRQPAEVATLCVSDEEHKCLLRLANAIDHSLELTMSTLIENSIGRDSAKYGLPAVVTLLQVMDLRVPCYEDDESLTPIGTKLTRKALIDLRFHAFNTGLSSGELINLAVSEFLEREMARIAPLADAEKVRLGLATG